MSRGWVLAISIVCLAVCALGIASSWSSNPGTVTPDQVKVINAQIKTLHEEVAAANSGGAWLVMVLAGTILAPLLLAALILVQADRAAIHSDEILLQLGQHGLTSEIIDTSRVLQKASTPIKLPKMPRLRLIGVEREHKSEETTDTQAEQSA